MSLSGLSVACRATRLFAHGTFHASHDFFKAWLVAHVGQTPGAGGFKAWFAISTAASLLEAWFSIAGLAFACDFTATGTVFTTRSLSRLFSRLSAFTAARVRGEFSLGEFTRVVFSAATGRAGLT